MQGNQIILFPLLSQQQALLTIPIFTAVHGTNFESPYLNQISSNRTFHCRVQTNNDQQTGERGAIQ